ncbi:MAG: VCBS repeat-containing protein [Planctomycetota bacterium]|nr:MAG: VCBS repeat-containing protein [Planctomycetota bacterium]
MRPLLPSLVFLLLAACGGDSAPDAAESAATPPTPAGPAPRSAPERPQPVAPTAAPGAAARPSQDPDVLLPPAEMQLPDWARENLERKDPRVDQWRSEVLHGAAKKALQAFLDATLEAETVDPEALRPLLAPDFAGIGALRPDRLEEVFRGGGVVVRRAASIPDGLRPLAELPAAVGGLMALFDGIEHPHVFFKYIRVDLRGEDGVGTTAILHADGWRGTAGVQMNAEWQLEWAVGASDEEVLLRSLRAVSYEEIEAEGRLFADYTRAVFPDDEAFRAEMLHGVGEYQHRTDRLLGSSFIGAQGVAVGDIDGDGRDDLFVPQQAGLPNRLYLRNPDGTLRDATAESGLGILDNTRSALILDVDEDGDQDIVMAVHQHLVTALNGGGGRFESLVPSNGEGTEDIYSLAAADADGDGDVDLYACRYVQNGLIGGVPTPYHDADNGAANLFFRNEGGGRFRVATAEVGLDHHNSKFSLAALWEDLDEDGDLDLYVTNDFGRNNLYRNDGGRFRDVADEVGAEDMAAGMGITAADFDLDGHVDLYVSNMFSSAGRRIVPQEQYMGGEHDEVRPQYLRHARGNTLLRGLGGGRYQDVTDQAGVAIGGWAWGAREIDLDNNGYADLYSPNGFVTNKSKDDL